MQNDKVESLIPRIKHELELRAHDKVYHLLSDILDAMEGREPSVSNKERPNQAQNSALRGI